MNVTVSVIMITYLHDKYITDAIKGVINQRCYFNVELIIADDNSPGQTKTVVDNFLKESNVPKNIKVTYKKHTVNKGANRNYLWAVNGAKGNYIANCEGDDYWTDPLKLQKQVDFLEKNEDYVMCFTRFQTKNETTGVFRQDNNGHYFSEINKVVDFDFEKFYKGWHIGTQTVLFKNNPSIMNNFSKYNQPRDVTLYTELLKLGKGACLKDITAVYRITGQGVYTSIDKKGQIKKGAEVYQDIFTINKNNYYLKLKYRKFLKPYLKQLLNDVKLFKFLNEILHSYRLTNDINYLKEDLDLLLKKIKSKL